MYSAFQVTSGKVRSIRPNLTLPCPSPGNIWPMLGRLVQIRLVEGFTPDVARFRLESAHWSNFGRASHGVGPSSTVSSNVDPALQKSVDPNPPKSCGLYSGTMTDQRSCRRITARNDALWASIFQIIRDVPILEFLDVDQKSGLQSPELRSIWARLDDKWATFDQSWAPRGRISAQLDEDLSVGAEVS